MENFNKYNLHYLLIFFGAGMGGMLRYWLSTKIYHIFGQQFPYGTLIVNMSGCFLIGFFIVLILDKFFLYGPILRSLFLIGFLGGYTTFSTFSLETINLLEAGETLKASLNIFLSTIFCIGATWIGILIGRKI